MVSALGVRYDYDHFPDVTTLLPPHPANRDISSKRPTWTGSMVDELKNMPRYLRWLRISWTAFSGIAALLFVALWVRSEHHFDSIGSVLSAQGRLYLSPNVAFFPTDVRGATIESYSHLRGAVTTIVARNVEVTPASGTGPVIPLWAPALIASITAIAPWLPIRRFSLRTLLIATTLLSILLGLVAWSIT